MRARKKLVRGLRSECNLEHRNSSDNVTRSNVLSGPVNADPGVENYVQTSTTIRIDPCIPSGD